LKKLSAILLLAVMAFNLVGYRVMFGFMWHHANAQMVKKLDTSTYDRSSLTEVKVPLHLPYAINDKDFERYDGSIELNGVIYNYVERKLQNDTLILHCIPNNAANNIKVAGNEFNKSINDFQPVQKGQKNTNTALLLKALECAGCKAANTIAINNVLYSIQRSAYKNTSEKIVAGNFSKSPEQPPELA